MKPISIALILALMISSGWSVELEPGFLILADNLRVKKTGSESLEILNVDLSNNGGFKEARLAVLLQDESGEFVKPSAGISLKATLAKRFEPDSTYFAVTAALDAESRFSVPLEDGDIRLRFIAEGESDPSLRITVVANMRKESYFGRGLNEEDLLWHDRRYNELHTNEDGVDLRYEDPGFISAKTLGDLASIFAFDLELIELFAEDCRICCLPTEEKDSCIQTPEDLARSIARGHFMWTLKMENIEPPSIEIFDGTATITSKKRMIGPKGGLGGAMEELDRWEQTMTVEVQDGKIVATEMTMEMEEPSAADE